MRFYRYAFPLLIGSFALTACLSAPGAAPIGLQATNVSDSIAYLQGTQAAFAYMATQTPYAATQEALGTQSALDGQAQATKSALDTQATALALQLLADNATATQVALSTQAAYNLQATARADEMTQVAFYVNATATQRSFDATATQEALDYARKEQVNNVIAWTPFAVAVAILVLLWRFVIIFEDRKSVFNTPGGEMVFTRKTSPIKALFRALLRRVIPEISFDEFVMPSRALGHALKEDQAGYNPSKDPDPTAQYQLIMLEQLRARGLPMPGPVMGSIPQLPAHAGLLGEAGEIEILNSANPEITTWIADVEDCE